MGEDEESRRRKEAVFIVEERSGLPVGGVLRSLPIWKWFMIQLKQHLSLPSVFLFLEHGLDRWAPARHACSRSGRF